MKPTAKHLLLYVAVPLVALVMAVAVVALVSPATIERCRLYVEHVAYKLGRRYAARGVDASLVAVDGIDVSHHNGWIDWDQVAQNKKIQFVYVKATQGTSFIDPMYRHNVREASAAGLNVGVYHFFTAKASGASQFRHFRKTVGQNAGNLIPMVDVERDGGVDGMTAAQLQTELATFCELVQKEYGCYPIIYTSTGIHDKMLGGRFDDHPLWIAHYGKRPHLRGARHAIWQFTSQGVVKGIDHRVDLNRLDHGTTVEQLKMKP